MSDKTVKPVKKSRKKVIFKWIAGIAAISILELGAVFTAVRITESRSQNYHSAIEALAKKNEQLSERLNKFAVLPDNINLNAQQIAATTGDLKLLIENFKVLKDEVGNKKVDLLNQQITALSHRIESVEETKNQEALVLSLALMIKENALYGRNFTQEADVLAELAQNQEQIQPAINTLFSLKNKIIPTDDQLASAYTKIIDRFDFEPAVQQSADTEEKGTVAKGIDLIKNTVTGINFDKVVMVKKDTKTNEQKQLLAQLTNMVNHYQFEKAVDFIDQHDVFAKAQNQEFNLWLARVKEKNAFNEAITTIIRTELSAMREDFKNTVLVTEPDASLAQSELSEEPND